MRSKTILENGALGKEVLGVNVKSVTGECQERKSNPSVLKGVRGKLSRFISWVSLTEEEYTAEDDEDNDDFIDKHKILAVPLGALLVGFIYLLMRVTASVLMLLA